MIGIVDYEMGNLLSVFNAFEYLGADSRICKHPEDLYEVDKIVIPGVGAFRDCIAHIKEMGFKEALHELTLGKGVPTLGICLGLQVFGKKGYEGGEHEGLGFFDGEVVKISENNSGVKVPSIGWHAVSCHSHAIFKGLPEVPDFYFVHSYYLKLKNPREVIATYSYGNLNITAAIAKDNIVATQFHPEKSQDYGLKIIDNFINWNP